MNNPFTITGFADEIGPSLSYQMDVLDELGIKHIEFRAAEGKNVMAFTDEEAESAAAAMKERGFAVSALGSPIGKYDIDKPFEPHYDDFLRALDLADILGTKYIRMFSFFIPEGKDPADFRDEVFKRTEAFIKKASERGIVLLHENERYIYGDNVERSLDLMKNFYCDNYRFTFDPGNFIHCDEEVFPYAYETLRPYIAYMHVKDAKYAKTPGTWGEEVEWTKGEVNADAFIAALRDVGYGGCLAVEREAGDDRPGDIARAVMDLRRRGISAVCAPHGETEGHE